MLYSERAAFTPSTTWTTSHSTRTTTATITDAQLLCKQNRYPFAVNKSTKKIMFTTATVA